VSFGLASQAKAVTPKHSRIIEREGGHQRASERASARQASEFHLPLKSVTPKRLQAAKADFLWQASGVVNLFISKHSVVAPSCRDCNNLSYQQVVCRQTNASTMDAHLHRGSFDVVRAETFRVHPRKPVEPGAALRWANVER
jgi:hypothetical protein